MKDEEIRQRIQDLFSQNDGERVDRVLDKLIGENKEKTTKDPRQCL